MAGVGNPKVIARAFESVDLTQHGPIKANAGGYCRCFVRDHVFECGDHAFITGSLASCQSESARKASQVRNETHETVSHNHHSFSIAQSDTPATN
jgi:hypothetical protein